MEVIHSYLCEAVKTEAGGIYSVGRAGITILNNVQLPMGMPNIGIVVYYKAAKEWFEQKHKLGINLLNTKDERQRLGQEIDFQIMPTDLDKVCNLVLNTGPQVYNEVGTWKYVVEIDNEDIVILPLAVKLHLAVAKSKIMLPNNGRN